MEGQSPALSCARVFVICEYIKTSIIVRYVAMILPIIIIDCFFLVICGYELIIIDYNLTELPEI